MATYFDATSPTDQALLPKAIRASEELANVAALAEADVIAQYTRSVPYLNFTSREEYLRDGIVSTEVVGEDISNQSAPSNAIVPRLMVFLRGYKVDSADALVDPGLKLAMKRTVAEVTRWRLAQWHKEILISSSSDSIGKSRQYADNAGDAFPPDWNRWLQPYESEEPLWAF
jgi:hypothetical protein